MPFSEDSDRFPILTVGGNPCCSSNDSLSDVPFKKPREEISDAEKKDVQTRSNLQSSVPVVVPKTVPLYLESTNDVLPGSPSFKYLQISPENNEKSFTFPEVTFSNIIALKTKNLDKNGKHDYAGALETEGSSTEDGGRPKKVKRPSKEADEVLSTRHHPFDRGDDTWTIPSFPERSASKPSRIVASDAFAVDQSELFEKTEKGPDRKRKTEIFHGEEIWTKATAADGRYDLEARTRRLLPDANKERSLRSGSETEVDPGEGTKPSVASSPSSPSLLPSEKNPNHQYKKPEPIVRAEPPRRHRHSVAGHQNLKQNLTYFKLYGISVGPTGILFNQSDRAKNKVLSSTSSLFSTAVISGSSSAPNLRDSITDNTTVSGKFLMKNREAE